MLRAFPIVWRCLKYPVAFMLAGIGLVLAWWGIDYLVGDAVIWYSEVGFWIDGAATLIVSAWSLRLAMLLVRRPRALASQRAGRAWRIFRLLAVAVGVASLCVVMTPVITMARVAAYLWLYANPGPFDRPRMERIVAQIRQFDFKGNKQFLVDPSGNVQPWAEHGYSHGLFDAVKRTDYDIEAERDDHGKLTVAIVTRNLGHAGSYGFSYSDKILKPEPDEFSYGGLSLGAGCGVDETDRNGKIDDHWWKVADTQN